MILAMVENKLNVMDTQDFITATFNPLTDYKVYFSLKVSGKTYNDRKQDLIEKAHIYQQAMSEYDGLSYGDFFALDDFFEDNGKRYGCMREFKDNGIIGW